MCDSFFQTIYHLRDLHSRHVKNFKLNPLAKKYFFGFIFSATSIPDALAIFAFNKVLTKRFYI